MGCDPLRTGTMRAVEAGPEGVEYLAFGAGSDPTDAELVPDWWAVDSPES